MTFYHTFISTARSTSPHIRRASTWPQLKLSLERHAPIDVHPEVQEALAHDKPVVALETTLITHGFPQPRNFELGRSLENIVRSTGSIPATIGIIGGRVKVGLEECELQRLAERTHKPVKLSRRDIAAAIAMNADGGTTCSATLIFAALAGIKVFATGGLGGVHRGGEHSMDISADLMELTRCPVGLVSAGVKSILDIGRTLEYLETLGVPVFSYGTSREFPAFFSRQSGFEAPWNVPDPLTAARVLHTQWKLGMGNGALIAVPIPEEHEAMGAEIQKAVDQAVAESEENGVNKRGKEATPWLLKRIGELTKGRSLTSNVALLENTALIGGQIAVQYHRLLNTEDAGFITTGPTTGQRSVVSKNGKPSVYEKQNRWLPAKLVVVGSAAVDITAKAAPSDQATLLNSTVPGDVSLTLGGVARNITEAAHRVLASSPSPSVLPLLISPIGDDSFGRLLKTEISGLGMRTDGLLTDMTSHRTAVCNMVLNAGGGLVGGIADMEIARAFTAERILPLIIKNKPKILAVDGNLSSSILTEIVKHCKENDIKVFFEPTSIVKSSSILPAIVSCLDSNRSRIAPITFASPNLYELSHMYQVARSEPYDLLSRPAWWEAINQFHLGAAYRMDLEQLAKKKVCDEDHSKGTLAFLVDEGIAQMAVNLLPFFQHLVIKCGERGVLAVMHLPATHTGSWVNERSNPLNRYIVTHGSSSNVVVLQHFPAHILKTVINVTGAGDSFVGALLASLILEPNLFQNREALRKTMTDSQHAASLTLQSHLAVSPAILYEAICQPCNIQ